jgi:hypothetical protein
MHSGEALSTLASFLMVYAYQKTAIGAHEDADMVTGPGYGRVIVGTKPEIGNGCSAHTFKWRWRSVLMAERALVKAGENLSDQKYFHRSSH